MDQKTYPLRAKWLCKSGIVTFLAILFFWFSAMPIGGEVAVFGMYIPLKSYHIGVVVIWLVFFSIPLSNFMTFKFNLGDDSVQSQQGLFSVKKANIPYANIQDVFVQQDFFDRILGIYTVVIKTTGFGGPRRASFLMKIFTLGFGGYGLSIPGLVKQDADSLQDFLMQKTGHRGSN